MAPVTQLCLGAILGTYQRFKLQAELHTASSRHKLCLWAKHARNDVNPLELLVDYLSLHLEHPASERPCYAPTSR